LREIQYDPSSHLPGKVTSNHHTISISDPAGLMMLRLNGGMVCSAEAVGLPRGVTFKPLPRGVIRSE
jgi:hypothetical protein